MASLADVNQTLIYQNESLADIARGTLDTQQLIQKQISLDTGFKSIEASREKGSGIGGVSGAIKGVKDTGAKIGSFFKGKGLAGIGAALVGGLVTRGIPALVAASLSDNIAEYLTGEEGNKEVKETIERSILGGSLGFLLGWRGALIGSLLGALLNDENKKKLEELGTQFGSLATEFGVMLPTFEQTLGVLTDSFGNLISFIGGIVGTITGITRTFKAFTDDDETTSGFEELETTATDAFKNFKENALGAAIAIGGLFTILRPFKSVGLALSAIKGIATKTGSLLGKSASTAAATTAKAAAGSVVMSKAGNMMIAGADGQATTTKAPAGSKVGDIPALNGSKIGKYAKLIKFLKFPGIGLVMSVPEIISIVTSDKSTSEKAKGLSGIIGGTLASGGGAVLGGAIGAFGGPAAPLTAPLGMLAGGIGGYFLGDYLTKKIVGLMLGEPDNSELETGGSAQPAQPLNDFERGQKRRTQKSINMLESGASYKINGKEATPEQRQARIDKEYDKLAVLDEKDFRYKQRMEQSQYRPGTVSESISTEALQENVDAKNQPAVVMQDTSSKQVNNVSNSSQPVVAPMVNNLDVNDALMPYSYAI